MNKIFKILVEGPTLGSLVSFAIMERVVLRSGTGRTMLLRFQMLHPGLTLESFEEILDRELQRSEVVIHSVNSKWILLRVQELTLLESALPATQIAMEGLRDVVSISLRHRHG